MRMTLVGFDVSDCPVCGSSHSGINFHPQGNGYLAICPAGFDLIRMSVDEGVYGAMLRDVGVS